MTKWHSKHITQELSIRYVARRRLFRRNCQLKFVICQNIAPHNNSPARAYDEYLRMVVVAPSTNHLLLSKQCAIGTEYSCYADKRHKLLSIYFPKYNKKIHIDTVAASRPLAAIPATNDINWPRLDEYFQNFAIKIFQAWASEVHRQGDYNFKNDLLWILNSHQLSLYAMSRGYRNAWWLHHQTLYTLYLLNRQCRDAKSNKAAFEQYRQLFTRVIRESNYLVHSQQSPDFILPVISAAHPLLAQPYGHFIAMTSELQRQLRIENFLPEKRRLQYRDLAAQLDKFAAQLRQLPKADIRPHRLLACCLLNISKLYAVAKLAHVLVDDKIWNKIATLQQIVYQYYPQLVQLQKILPRKLVHWYYVATTAKAAAYQVLRWHVKDFRLQLESVQLAPCIVSKEERVALAELCACDRIASSPQLAKVRQGIVLPPEKVRALAQFSHLHHADLQNFMGALFRFKQPDANYVYLVRQLLPQLLQKSIADPNAQAGLCKLVKSFCQHLDKFSACELDALLPIYKKFAVDIVCGANLEQYLHDRQLLKIEYQFGKCQQTQFLKPGFRVGERWQQGFCRQYIVTPKSYKILTLLSRYVQRKGFQLTDQAQRAQRQLLSPAFWFANRHLQAYQKTLADWLHGIDQYVYTEGITAQERAGYEDLLVELQQQLQKDDKELYIEAGNYSHMKKNWTFGLRELWEILVLVPANAGVEIGYPLPAKDFARNIALTANSTTNRQYARGIGIDPGQPPQADQEQKIFSDFLLALNNLAMQYPQLLAEPDTLQQVDRQQLLQMLSVDQFANIWPTLIKNLSSIDLKMYHRVFLNDNGQSTLQKLKYLTAVLELGDTITAALYPATLDLQKSCDAIAYYLQNMHIAITPVDISQIKIRHRQIPFLHPNRQALAICKRRFHATQQVVVLQGNNRLQGDTARFDYRDTELVSAVRNIFVQLWCYGHRIIDANARQRFDDRCRAVYENCHCQSRLIDLIAMLNLAFAYRDKARFCLELRSFDSSVNIIKNFLQKFAIEQVHANECLKFDPLYAVYFDIQYSMIVTDGAPDMVVRILKHAFYNRDTQELVQRGKLLLSGGP